MQARVAEQLRDPVMRGLAYSFGGYTAASFVYSLVNKENVKAAPKKEEAKAVARKDTHAPAAAAAPAAAHATEHAVIAAGESAANKQQVAPVLQQLTQISDRLTKIEKALGI